MKTYLITHFSYFINSLKNSLTDANQAQNMIPWPMRSEGSSVYQRPPQPLQTMTSSIGISQIQPSLKFPQQYIQQQHQLQQQQRMMVRPQQQGQQQLQQQGQQQQLQQPHHPNCNTQLRQITASNTNNIMTQSYPGPGILMPQKISRQSANAANNETNGNQIDKEFLAELEKNLGTYYLLSSFLLGQLIELIF